jgi:FkbM family methyltransferase
MKQPDSKTIAFIDNYSGRRFNLRGSSADKSVIAVIENDGGTWEPHLVNLFHRLIRSDDICLDIGANIGAHTLIMSSLARDGHIHAFEPSSLNFGFLSKNLEDNHATNVTAHRLGLSNVAGPRPFHTLVDIPGASFAGELVTAGQATSRNVGKLIRAGLGCDFPYTSEAAEFSTLDQWTAENNVETSHLVKMDVEGSEDFVVEGGSSFLRKVKPFFISELNIKSLKYYFGIEPINYFNRLADIYEYIYVIDNYGGLVRARKFAQVEACLTEAKYWADVLCSASEVALEPLDPRGSLQRARPLDPAFPEVRSVPSGLGRSRVGAVANDASTAKINVLYFTVVPLAVLNNGGTLCCRNHIRQLASDPQVKLTIATTGPAEWAHGNQEFARTLGYNSIHIPFQCIPKGWRFLPDALLFPHEKWAPEYASINKGLLSVVEELAPDVIIVDYLPSALYVRSIFDLAIPRVVITLNRESEFFREQRRSGQVAGPKLCAWIANFRFWLWERWVQRHCSGLVALSCNDLPTGLPRSVVLETMPPTLARSAERWSDKGSKDVFFVGNVNHYPNRMAMEWICTQLAVEVEALDPEIRFRLIGATKEAVPESWRRPCVEFLGLADDKEVTRRFIESALFIAPIANNFGSKMKLLECLSHGTPFIATVPAMSGLPFLEGLDTIDLKRPRDAARLIGRMLGNPEMLVAMSRSNDEATSRFQATRCGEWGRYLRRVIGSAEASARAG